jgi:hypothetical protein
VLVLMPNQSPVDGTGKWPTCSAPLVRTPVARWRLMVGGVGILAWFLASCYQGLPVILRLANYYPALASATILNGKVAREEGAQAAKPGSWRRQYIVNDRGRHAIFCGFRQHAYPCFSNNLFANGQATVWQHPLFGALQYEVVSTEFYPARDGRPAEPIKASMPYSAGQSVYYNHFNWGRYVPALLQIAFSACAFLYVLHFAQKPR